MLLRLIIENFASFKEATEFNTFPSSKSHNHENHKVKCGHTDVLRMSAIYGANGAGKSNMILALRVLSELVLNESLKNANIQKKDSFKFDDTYEKKPMGIAVEFFHGGNVYFYHIEFDETQIYIEELLWSKRTKDVEVFTRKGADITLNRDLFHKGFNGPFVEGIKRLLRPDMLLLSLMGKYYPDEVTAIRDAYGWFFETLRIVSPMEESGYVPHLLDSIPDFKELSDRIMPELKTGIAELKVKKDVIKEDEIVGNAHLQMQVNNAKKFPGIPFVLVSSATREFANVVYEDDVVYMKTLISVHRDMQGKEYEMPIVCESDGTKRLIEYLPILFNITQNDSVMVVDEIERSIHPILIKDIIRKISEDDQVKGQLIFTTHESALLDQDLFRPDEIWFAQKNTEQATQLYPLSDFNVHHTANIEKGYLNGRYGGIPFLSNLKDLHW